MGFDHIAIAAGANKPTLVNMKNNLIRGIRAASDFLMALQLTGAFKRDSLANLQVQLPAIVIGGGLTAIDTATELFAYYPVQVEKALERYEQLTALHGESVLFARMTADEREIYDRFLEHGLAVRAERVRAAEMGDEPDFVKLVRRWGGVSLCYRRGVKDSPVPPEPRGSGEGAGRGHSLHRARVARRGGRRRARRGEALKLERMAVVEGKLRGSGEIYELPARTICVAAGTSPNVTLRAQMPGTFELDADGSYFKGYALKENGAGFDHRARRRTARRHPGATAASSPATAAERPLRFVLHEDNHPTYAGNVVKADGLGERTATPRW